MALVLSAEQLELQATLRQLCEASARESDVRRVMASPTDRDGALWKTLAVDIGVAGLGVPENMGGSGGGPVELSVAASELGRSLACVPFFSSSVLATQALLLIGDRSAQGDYLHDLCLGARTATLALTEENCQWSWSDLKTSARTTGGDEVVLTGSKDFVLDAGDADLFLVLARSPVGPALYAVGRSARGVLVEKRATLDQTRPMGRLHLVCAPARPVGTAADFEAGWRRLMNLASVLLAAEQVGGARRVLEMTVAHAKQREQFGRPIGSFQAVKHSCAEMLLQVETATSAVEHGLELLTERGQAELETEVADVARVYCSQAYLDVARRSIQIFGAIGFTWEHACQLYLKRALGTAQLLGSAEDRLRDVADRLCL